MPHRDRPESVACLNDRLCPTRDQDGCPHWDYEDETPHLAPEQITKQHTRVIRWKRDRKEGRA